MICVIEDNHQIVSCLKNNSIIFALYDFEGFKDPCINNFNIFIINSKRLNNKGIPSLSLIKNIKKTPYKKVIIVGELDDMMKSYYTGVGVDYTTNFPFLCDIVKQNIELYRKLKQMQKYSASFPETFPEMHHNYDDNIIEQIKIIFFKYLGTKGDSLLQNYMKKGIHYKDILKEGYSLVSDDRKKIFLEEIRNIHI